jgi:hypothetical protein
VTCPLPRVDIYLHSHGCWHAQPHQHVVELCVTCSRDPTFSKSHKTHTLHYIHVSLENLTMVGLTPIAQLTHLCISNMNTPYSAAIAASTCTHSPQSAPQSSWIASLLVLGCAQAVAARPVPAGAVHPLGHLYWLLDSAAAPCSLYGAPGQQPTAGALQHSGWHPLLRSAGLWLCCAVQSMWCFAASLKWCNVNTTWSWCDSSSASCLPCCHTYRHDVLNLGASLRHPRIHCSS